MHASIATDGPVKLRANLGDDTVRDTEEAMRNVALIMLGQFIVAESGVYKTLRGREPSPSFEFFSRVEIALHCVRNRWPSISEQRDYPFVSNKPTVMRSVGVYSMLEQ